MCDAIVVSDVMVHVLFFVFVFLCVLLLNGHKADRYAIITPRIRVCWRVALDNESSRHAGSGLQDVPRGLRAKPVSLSEKTCRCTFSPLETEVHDCHDEDVCERSGGGQNLGVDSSVGSRGVCLQRVTVEHDVPLGCMEIPRDVHLLERIA